MTPIVFSDDDAWCREHFPDAAIAPPANRPEEHLILMTLCKSHVIANSSFSWWGAVLSDDPSPVYPRPWFGPNLARVQLEWTIPPGWTPSRQGEIGMTAGRGSCGMLDLRGGLATQGKQSASHVIVAAITLLVQLDDLPPPCPRASWG